MSQPIRVSQAFLLKGALIIGLLSSTLLGSNKEYSLSLLSSFHSVSKGDSNSVDTNSLGVEGKVKIKGFAPLIYIGVNSFSDRDTFNLRVGARDTLTMIEGKEIYGEVSGGVIYQKWSESPLKSADRKDSDGYSMIGVVESGVYLDKRTTLFARVGLHRLETEISVYGKSHTIKDSGSFAVGIELIKEVRKIDLLIPIVILSSHPKKDFLEVVDEYRVVEFIEKPMFYDVFKRLISLMRG